MFNFPRPTGKTSDNVTGMVSVTCASLVVCWNCLESTRFWLVIHIEWTFFHPCLVGVYTGSLQPEQSQENKNGQKAMAEGEGRSGQSGGGGDQPPGWSLHTNTQPIRGHWSFMQTPQTSLTELFIGHFVPYEDRFLSPPPEKATSSNYSNMKLLAFCLACWSHSVNTRPL